MHILLMCPAHLATGGTESIHQLCRELCWNGADAQIWYVGEDLNDPQPKEYQHYQCKYITEFPQGYDGVIIFPEIYGNEMLKPEYRNCTVVMNWQGVDVYYWSVSQHAQNAFLNCEDAIHITNCEYGMDHLRKLGLEPIKISDSLNEDFFKIHDTWLERKDEVLYNPTPFKMTRFQKIVMSRCTTEFGIKFLPLSGYSRSELIDVFRSHKLYIDFGVFSGRERLPREAVTQGCCILTSKSGAAGYYADNSIKDVYKTDSADYAVQMIKYILQNYDRLADDYSETRRLLYQDRENYHREVTKFYEILSNHTCSQR